MRQALGFVKAANPGVRKHHLEFFDFLFGLGKGLSSPLQPCLNFVELATSDYAEARSSPCSSPSSSVSSVLGLTSHSFVCQPQQLRHLLVEAISGR